MGALTKVQVTCPHAHCGDTFSYPEPDPDQIVPGMTEVIKKTNCPICEQPVKVRFEIEREVEVYRDGQPSQGRLIFKNPSVSID